MKKQTLFEAFGEPISTYTDSQAVEDGGLIAINADDRVTRAVWDWLYLTVDMKNPKPPIGWPVNLFGFFAAQTPDKRVLAMCDGLIEMNRREAIRVYEQNIGGGIFGLWVRHEGGYGGKPIAVEDKETGGQMRLWFVPNGAGITLMFPEDY
jgi:hypothetical protein